MVLYAFFCSSSEVVATEFLDLLSYFCYFFVIPLYVKPF